MFKKFFIPALVLLTVFSACENSDVVYPTTSVMEKFVEKANNVHDAETAFYESFKNFSKGEDQQMVQNYADFSAKVKEMDDFYNTITFISDYDGFTDEYSNKLKPYLDNYLGKIDEIMLQIKNEEEVDTESLKTKLSELDEISVGFTDVYNNFVLVFNSYFSI